MSVWSSRPPPRASGTPTHWQWSGRNFRRRSINYRPVSAALSEFYRWRVEDRQKRITTEPDRIELYDDLAVAYDKLGEHEKAIETILAKEKLKPGLYETYANLGTFYIHNGQLEEGLKHIDKAIEINPDAHFGREKYQRMLVEYVLTKRSRGVAELPLRRQLNGDFVNYVDFAGFIWSKRREKKDSLPRRITIRRPPSRVFWA